MFPSKRIGLIVGGAIGLAIAAAIILGALALREVGREAARRRLTDSHVNALIRKSQPTRDERVRRIVEAIVECEHSERCARLLERARRRAAPPGASSRRTPPPSSRTIIRNAPRRVTPRPGRPVTHGRTPPASPRVGPTPAPSSPTSSSPPPPPQPQPPATVTTPLVPLELCTGLVDVNCPTA